MKLISYADALKMGKDKLGKVLIPVKVNKARKQAELEMCKLDEQIAVKEDALHTACLTEDLKFNKIIDLQDDLVLLERKRTQYQTILDEMFPEK